MVVLSAGKVVEMRPSFDEIANQFDHQRGLPREALQAWLELIAELASGRQLQIIEPGIGTGRVALPLAALGHTITGTDISEPMLAACEATARRMGIDRRVELIVGDATTLSFPDHSFDLGLIAQLFYLVPDWAAVLDELARVVKPSGYVIHLTEPTTENVALSRWSATWRELIEATGYRHTALSPADEEVHAEFLRRWPDVEIRELASWDFGQTVEDATNGYADRVRPLYTSVPDQGFSEAVDSFLDWAEEMFPDRKTWLGGRVTLTAMIALV